MSSQDWDSAGYEKNARFVTTLGAPVFELLAAKAGEDVLDIGCGDGVLTRQIADLGCKVTGVDSSAALVAAARRLGVHAIEQSATEMEFYSCFDAAFSNAALHWIKDADRVIGRVARALRSNGRFVAEMGGHGCVKTIQCALIEELERRGHDGQAANPWYFPTPDDYAARLMAGGFEVRTIALIPRPTPLPGDLIGWLATFSGCFSAVLPEAERESYLESVRRRIKPYLCDAQGKWTADYVRLRFEAHRAGA